MNQVIRALIVMALFIPLTGGAHAQNDVPGSKDYPMLGRMTDFYISSYEEKEFDSHAFTDSKGNDVRIEGRTYTIQYDIKEDAKVPTPLQITRNYVNAIKKLGGSAYEYTEGTAFLNLIKKGQEVWVEVYASGESYALTIVEKAGLKQEVSASDMLKALNQAGHIALYINFDTGKSTIKPDSKPVIDEIVALLKQNPDLKVAIEGHTDNVGKAQSNKTLSEQRAQAVLDAIVKQGVDSKRLTAAGFGAERPIADNKIEEGRAKNRRVELVKK
jgi:outer membrane protein OmpA-like peptidoglycan-associated protein